MSSSRFFVELPADKHGNTSMTLAVVEAKIEISDYAWYRREMLVPIAPKYHAERWPSGWYRDLYGGWAETNGPARLLTRDEWKVLVDSLPEAAKETAQGDSALLKNGEYVSVSLARKRIGSMNALGTSNPPALLELFQRVREPDHRPDDSHTEALMAGGFLDSGGNVTDLTISIISNADTSTPKELTLGDLVRK